MDSNQQQETNAKQQNMGKYAMDYGLVGISKLKTGHNNVKLPKSVAFDPSEGKIEEKLTKVLEFKTLNNTMFQLLRPIITDRSVISPHNFRLKIHQVCDMLENEIKKQGYVFIYKELFEDAIELLRTEEDKCELLDQYRHMLLMG